MPDTFSNRPITHLSDDLLRQWPLPMPGAEGDKKERGRILIVGVALHARAGVQLAARLGPLGYLAREIAAEVPALMHALGAAENRESA